MLSRVVNNISSPRTNFEIRDRSEAREEKRAWDCEVSQTYINNSTLELTVMDNLGFRMTIPRQNNRNGPRGFLVVREYTIRHGLNSKVSDFLDEISIDDGVILNAIKEKCKNKEVFSGGGFGNEHQLNYRFGYSFAVSFLYSEHEIAKHGNLYCALNGFVVSKFRREHMAVNPEYGMLNGFGFDPLGDKMTINVKSHRVVVNRPEIGGEEYHFTFAGTVVVADKTNCINKQPGIYIYEYKKDVSTGVVEEHEVKYVKFDEVTNKNGIFTDRHNAVLSINPDRQQRERDQVLRERSHELELMRGELEKQKLMNDSIRFDNDKVKLELEGKNQQLKIRVQDAEEQLSRANIELLRLKAFNERTTFENNTVIERQKFENIEAKHNFTMLEMRRSEELNDKKHVTILLENERSVILEEKRFDNKLLEHDMYRDKLDREERLETGKFLIGISTLKSDHEANVSHNRRKQFEEGFKLSTGILGFSGGLLKMMR